MNNPHSPKYLKNENSTSIVIFVHGFMGSPIQFERMSNYLYGKGFSTATVLLPGHGDSALTFTKVKLSDWEEHLKNEIEHFSNYDKIFLVGHSIGGLLCLNASVGNKKIKAVAAISSPLKLYIFHPIGLFRKAKLLFQNKNVKNVYKHANNVKLSPSFIFHFRRSLKHPYSLMEKTKSTLPNIKIPVLIVHSSKDETVAFESSKMLEQGLVNSALEVLNLTDSYHAYYTESEEKAIYEAVLNCFSK